TLLARLRRDSGLTPLLVDSSLARVAFDVSDLRIVAVLIGAFQLGVGFGGAVTARSSCIGEGFGVIVAGGKISSAAQFVACRRRHIRRDGGVAGETIGVLKDKADAGDVGNVLSGQRVTHLRPLSDTMRASCSASKEPTSCQSSPA